MLFQPVCSVSIRIFDRACSKLTFCEWMERWFVLGSVIIFTILGNERRSLVEEIKVQNRTSLSSYKISFAGYNNIIFQYLLNIFPKFYKTLLIKSTNSIRFTCWSLCIEISSFSMDIQFDYPSFGSKLNRRKEGSTWVSNGEIGANYRELSKGVQATFRSSWNSCSLKLTPHRRKFHTLPSYHLTRDFRFIPPFIIRRIIAGRICIKMPLVTANNRYRAAPFYYHSKNILFLFLPFSSPPSVFFYTSSRLI